MTITISVWAFIGIIVSMFFMGSILSLIAVSVTTTQMQELDDTDFYEDIEK